MAGNPSIKGGKAPGARTGKISAAEIAKISTNVNFDKATQAYLDQNFGSIAAWYDNPSIGPVLKAALVAGAHGTMLQGQAYQDFIRSHAVDSQGNVVRNPANSWWNNNSANVRNAQLQKINDPATYNNGVSNLLNGQIAPMAQGLGLHTDPNVLQTVAQQAYENGWTTTDQIKSALLKQYSYNPTADPMAGGAVGKTTNDFASIAADYGVTLPSDPNKMSDFVKGAIGPNGTTDAFTEYAKQQAQLNFPWMSQSIQNGATVKGYLSQYTGNIASTLGISPDSINWSDPKWKGVVAKVQPDGSTLPQTLDQALTTVKTDPRFGYDQTTQAKNDAYSTLNAIGQMFGKQG